MHLLTNKCEFSVSRGKLSDKNLECIIVIHGQTILQCKQVIVEMLSLDILLRSECTERKKNDSVQECKQCSLCMKGENIAIHISSNVLVQLFLFFFILVLTPLQISMCFICFSSCQFFPSTLFFSVPSLGFSIQRQMIENSFEVKKKNCSTVNTTNRKSNALLLHIFFSCHSQQQCERMILLF